MKMIIILLIILTLVAGMVDGGDITAAVVMGMLFLPQVFERGEKKNGKRKRCGNSGSGSRVGI